MIRHLIWLMGLGLICSFGCENGGAQRHADSTQTEITSARTVAMSTSSIGSQCTFSTGFTGPGEQHLALLIGINDYAADGVPGLPGTKKDIETFSELLTESTGRFRVPTQNICVLQDEDATLQNVLSAFNQFLLQRLDEDDRVTIYYSGHGSQIDDPDGASDNFKDETLFLHDSGVPLFLDGRISAATPHLTDDVLGGLLRKISLQINPQQFSNEHSMLVILDACNSYSATRGDRIARIANDPIKQQRLSTLGVSKYAPLDAYLREAGLSTLADELTDSGETLTSFAPPGAVVMSAASDGYSAYEDSAVGQGYFTAALLEEVLSSERALTYEELEVRLLNHPRMKFQTPSIKGNLSAAFMGSVLESSGATHRVALVSNGMVHLSGPPIFGIGEGAVLLVFDGNSISVSDPNTAKASVKIIGADLFPARGTIESGANIQVGDIAVLFSASPSAKRLTIATSERLDRNFTESLESFVAETETSRTLEFVADPDAAEFMVDVVDGSNVSLVDAQGIVRFEFGSSPTKLSVTEKLRQFALQKSLRTLRGSGANAYRDNYTLELELIPITAALANNSLCADGVHSSGPVKKVARNSFIAPVCTRYELWVKANGLSSNQEIDVGVVGLSGNGNIYALPNSSNTVWGNPIRLTAQDQRQKVGDFWQASPPSDIVEEILLFGTDADFPVKWSRLGSAFRTRGETTSNVLERGLIEELTGGSRNAPGFFSQSSGLKPWTMTRVRFRTVSNTVMDGPSANEAEPPTAREYTVHGFDIRPYLPSDTSTALYRVLSQANELATQSKTFVPTNVESRAGQNIESLLGQGYPYTQHDWCAANEDGTINYSSNLEVGIDCSRSTWYAFTRAGLAYSTKEPLESRMACLPYGSTGNDYLTTADMAKSNSKLSLAFDSCVGDDLKIGDVLVYRDDDRNDGHTVMVIDPDKRIAWGSHGWDGQGRLGGIADSGVEYQFIKFKKDWQRWDRTTMTLRACWRHKTIAQELAQSSYSRSQMLDLLCTDGPCSAPQEPWAQEYLATAQ